MTKKHFGLVLGLLAVVAIPVLANEIIGASATVTCSGFNINFSANDLSTGVGYTISYTFQLNCGGVMTTVGPFTKSFTPGGSTFMVSDSGNWPSSPLTADCLVTGTAFLTSNPTMPFNITFNGTTLTQVQLICVNGVDERMTGGGTLDVTNLVGSPSTSASTSTSTPKVVVESFDVTHGFEIHCGAPPDTPNNLEINWPGHRFHLESLTLGTCTCNTSLLPPDNPDAGFNQFVGVGTGKLDGVDGASIMFTFTDQGEPGTNDTEKVEIFDPFGAPVLNFDTTKLTFGNQQAHREGGPKVPPCPGNGGA